MFSGKNKRLIRDRGAIDPQGLSYRKVLEHILANNSGIINVYAINPPGRRNRQILMRKDRLRLKYVNNVKNAKFIITNYRRRGFTKEVKDDTIHDYYNEYYTVKVNGEKICGAYKNQ